MLVRRSFRGVLVGVLLALCLAATEAVAAAPLPVNYNFIDGTFKGSQQDNAPGSNNWSCRPSKQHPYPVVLVHGTFENRANNWQAYAPLLFNNGYCVFALTYGSSAGDAGKSTIGATGSMTTSAKTLRTFVNRVLTATNATKVDLIGHSQGTLMPNYYVKFLGGAAHVRNYVSLASLWHGTKLADLALIEARLLGIDEDEFPLCAACAQFASGSRWLKNLRAGGVAVEGVHYTNIVTKHDELIVPYTSGIEAGMTNVVIQDKCALDLTDHLELAADPVAAAIVLNTLDPAHPRPVPCKLVLPITGPVG